MKEEKVTLKQNDINTILYGNCGRPKELLGYHKTNTGSYICGWNPNAERLFVKRKGETKNYLMKKLEEKGLFLFEIPKEDEEKVWSQYSFMMERDKEVLEYQDPYRFPNSIALEDRLLFEQGNHGHMYQILGAHKKEIDGVCGIRFAVYAPNAKRVSVLGEWNDFNAIKEPMQKIDEGGIFELFIPSAKEGMAYEYEIKTIQGEVLRKSDPYSFGQHKKKRNLSLVPYEGKKTKPLEKKTKNDSVIIYQVYPAAYKKRGKKGNLFLTYRQLAKEVAEDALTMGYTHIQLKGILEHETEESLGEDVTQYFAPTSRYGTREEFQYFVEYLHKKGLKVVLEWNISSFGTADYGLKQFDGQAEYEYENPLLAVQKNGKGLLFHYGKEEVRSFLLSSAFYWIEEMKVDGLFVDSIASMLYQDYGRIGKEWVKNPWGEKENLEAIAFLKQCNDRIKEAAPQCELYAEDNSMWQGVTEPATRGGLSFDGQWNSDWLIKYLSYLGHYPHYREYDFWKMEQTACYQFQSRNLLTVSHRETVVWNGTLIQKMPGEYFNRFAHLRMVYGYLFAYPSFGKLLFMGEDFAHWHPCDIEKGLNWNLLGEDIHKSFRRYVRDLIAFYKEKEVLSNENSKKESFEWFHKEPTYGIFSFIRKSMTGEGNLLFLFHHRQEMSRGYLLKMPKKADYTVVFHSDYVEYGGIGNSESGIIMEERSELREEEEEYLLVNLPPLSMIVFEYNK